MSSSNNKPAGAPPGKVVVVGGGTSGWLAAGYLSSLIGRSQPLEVVLVESPDIGVIGVGEATIPTLVRTLREMRIDEDEFLQNVNGSFKQAIRFQNWLHDPEEKPGYYYHPFHKASEADSLAAAQYLYYNPSAGPETYCRVATPQTMACDANKAPGPMDGLAKHGLTYAYHMDAALFGRFLRTRFEGNGVHRIEGKVSGVQRDSNGDITEVVLEDGSRITGDLFVDCSGFRGLLINQELGVPFESFSRWLPCDRALAVSVPYQDGDRVLPYTLATAQQSGWVWDINLASRRGVGHVYSSEYMMPEQAEEALVRYVGDAWPKDASVREIDIRVGRGKVFWQNNCVAIGLAGGFIEPLESTGIYLVEMGIKFLVDYWPTRGEQPSLRAGYNNLMRDAYQEVLEFVFMHYYTSQRRDSAFWRDFADRAKDLPGDLIEKLEMWRHKYPSGYDSRSMAGKVFGSESLIAILSGMDWFRGVRSPYVVADEPGLKAHLRQRLAEFERQISSYPDHEAYLRAHGVTVGATV